MSSRLSKNAVAFTERSNAMKRMLLFSAVAASLTMIQPAFSGDGWTIVTNGLRGSSVMTIVPRTGGSIAQIISAPPMTEEQIARDVKWAEFCKPRIVAQAPDWVRRYVYDKPGCEHGRTE